MCVRREPVEKHQKKSKNAAPAKKLYEQPTLRAYGSIQDLTQASLNMGANTDTRGPFTDMRTH
jgi:hypothetical protein